MTNELFVSKIKYEKKGNESLVLLNGGMDSFIKNEKTGEVGYCLFPIQFIGANIEQATIVDKKSKRR